MSCLSILVVRVPNALSYSYLFDISITIPLILFVILSSVSFIQPFIHSLLNFVAQLNICTSAHK